MRLTVVGRIPSRKPGELGGLLSKKNTVDSLESDRKEKEENGKRSSSRVAERPLGKRILSTWGKKIKAGCEKKLGGGGKGEILNRGKLNHGLVRSERNETFKGYGGGSVTVKHKASFHSIKESRKIKPRSPKRKMGKRSNASQSQKIWKGGTVTLWGSAQKLLGEESLGRNEEDASTCRGRRALGQGLKGKGSQFGWRRFAAQRRKGHIINKVAWKKD